MNKAYDIIRKDEVDAMSAAKNLNYSKYNRFKCLCCGERVYLAAANSNEKSPHFRHCRGNNDKDCERYLGQHGAIEHYVSIGKNKHERVRFYFNKERCTFEVSLIFSEEELRDYEYNKSMVTISEAKIGAEPFLSVPINKINFAANSEQYFVLKTYSNDYFISIDANKKVFRGIMGRKDKLNIYEVRQQDKRSKLNRTNLLYTETAYIGISENADVISELAEIKNSMFVEEKFKFRTMNVDFYGVIFSIKSEDYNINLFFNKNDYKIKISESLDILWPPVYTVDSDFVCNDDKIYIKSSFKLVPNINTNIAESSIQEIDENILKIFINDSSIICEKNIDVSIRKSGLIRDEITYDEPDTKLLRKYDVPDKDIYFLFDEDGYTRLYASSTIYLCETDKIIGYKNGHVKEIICGCPKKKMTTKEVIDDILMYHPQSEQYYPEEFINVKLSKGAVSYLDKCYHKGRINTVLKRYIKEGLI